MKSRKRKVYEATFNGEEMVLWTPSRKELIAIVNGKSLSASLEEILNTSPLREEKLIGYTLLKETIKERDTEYTFLITTEVIR